MVLVTGQPLVTGDTDPGPAPSPMTTGCALQGGVRGPGVMFPSAVKVATQVLRPLLLAVETVRAVSEPALDVSREPLARKLAITGLSDLDRASVREARGLATGQEAVEVGAGAGRPGDLARAQGRGHDEAARAAAVTGFLPVMSHAEAEIKMF